MPRSSRPRPVVLCILDGWGERRSAKDNAIRDAKTPNWHRFAKEGLIAHLQASESFVGLPKGQMGNSEVGHTNLGAGRVVLQDLPRIDRAVKDGSLAKNPALKKFIAALKKSGGTAHVLGLVSPGGVHAHQHHIAALVNAIAAAGVDVAVHAFLDGRDTPPKSAERYLAQFARDISRARGAAIATVSGRYYAMDRDKRWDRVQKAYAALTDAKGAHADNPKKAVAQSYADGKTDEFVLPTAIGAYRGMKDGDGVLCANFRADRVREILGALLEPSFKGFARARKLRFAAAAGLSEYSDALKRRMAVLFPPEKLTDTFGEIVSRAGLAQLRIAETEKYAHVTFFFNGGREDKFRGEQRILVPSPHVATYDMQPDMSAPEVTKKLVAAVKSGKFDAVVVNYANADMVGHTGDLAAAIKAVETVDACLGKLAAAVEAAGGTLLVTADHGNAETMRDPKTGQPHTQHTTNPVPLLLLHPPAQVKAIEDGRLCDIAPTLLQLMGLKQPKAMTGHTLLKIDGRARA